MKGMSLGTRMKNNYESVHKAVLPWRMPVIIRLDGRCFHTFTRKMKRPFDDELIANMQHLTYYLCSEISTAQFAYCQSDEISILLHPYKKLDSQPWFANEVQKIVSITSAMASQDFSRRYEKEVLFDSRVFVLPESEVVNYFIWRQQDASRNSIQMLAQANFSHKLLQKKNTTDLHELLHGKGLNWNDIETHKKRGFACYKTEKVWKMDTEIPIFSEHREFIEKYLVVEE